MGHLELVAHEGKKWGDEQRRAAPGIPQQLRRYEIDRALSPPGALNDQRPLPLLDDGLDCLELSRPKLGAGVARHGSQQRQSPGRDGRSSPGRGSLGRERLAAKRLQAGTGEHAGFHDIHTPIPRTKAWSAEDPGDSGLRDKIHGQSPTTPDDVRASAKFLSRNYIAGFHTARLPPMPQHRENILRKPGVWLRCT